MPAQFKFNNMQRLFSPANHDGKWGPSILAHWTAKIVCQTAAPNSFRWVLVAAWADAISLLTLSALSKEFDFEV